MVPITRTKITANMTAYSAMSCPSSDPMMLRKSCMDGSFHLLGFPDPSDHQIVYFEYHTGALYLEKPAEVTRYKLMFDHLRASALPVDASRSLMARAAEEQP